MQLEQTILDTVRHLTLEKQREVLDFARFLASKNGHGAPLRSLKDLCADLKVDISADEIDEARREMWANFPREDI